MEPIIIEPAKKGSWCQSHGEWTDLDLDGWKNLFTVTIANTAVFNICNFCLERMESRSNAALQERIEMKERYDDAIVAHTAEKLNLPVSDVRAATAGLRHVEREITRKERLTGA